MSTATTVPETHGQSGDDARDQLRRSGTITLMTDAAARFGAADGTSFARALGLSSVLTLIPALIAMVGLVTTLDLPNLKTVLADAAKDVAPGPAGSILSDALARAKPGSGSSALIVGLAGMLLSGTLSMIQLQRGANRVYGLLGDRPAPRRYGLALALAASAGVMLILGLAVVVAGGAIGDSAHAAGAWRDSTSTFWSFGRWPIGIALVAVSMTILFKAAPDRRQPKFSWLLSGTAVAVTTWVGATILLALVYEHSSVLGESFGPLLGMIALLVWAYATGIAVLFGLSFAAQLEAERADAT
jgi:uncharacterized BrkB/YihY/UPF0761 family membrane protein